MWKERGCYQNVYSATIELLLFLIKAAILIEIDYKLIKGEHTLQLCNSSTLLTCLNFLVDQVRFFLSKDAKKSHIKFLSMTR